MSETLFRIDTEFLPPAELDDAAAAAAWDVLSITVQGVCATSIPAIALMVGGAPPDCVRHQIENHRLARILDP